MQHRKIALLIAVLTTISCEKDDLVKKYERRNQANPRREEASDLKREKGRSLDVDPEFELRERARMSLEAMKEVLQARMDLLRKEADLKNTVTVGKAQLISLDVQDAREAFKDAEEKKDAEMKSLWTLEKKTGETYYGLLSEFFSYSNRVIFLQNLYQNHEMFSEVLRVSYKITLEEIEAGNYQAYQIDDPLKR